MDLKKSVKNLVKRLRLKNLLYYRRQISFCILIYVLWKLRKFTKRRYRNLIRVNKNKRYFKIFFSFY